MEEFEVAAGVGTLIAFVLGINRHESFISVAFGMVGYELLLLAFAGAGAGGDGWSGFLVIASSPIAFISPVVGLLCAVPYLIFKNRRKQ